MQVVVEFFGIPRARAGVPVTTCGGETLGQVFTELAARFPELAETCFESGRLRPGYIANLDGQQFIDDPKTLLNDGQAILILSADVGG